MSNNTITKNNMMFPPAVLAWPKAMTDKGEVPEFRCEIPADVAGLLIVWKVPVCEAHPDGYFMSLNESEWNISVPGCLGTDQLELCRVQLGGFATGNAESDNPASIRTTNTVVCQCPDISIDTSLLNPTAVPIVITSKTKV